MIAVSAIQKAHPEWNVVDAIDAPGGGIWAVGADGGVFALDATGNPSTATPMFGSYPGLRPEQRLGNRTFTGIEPDPETGGYKLISNQNEVYRFLGDRRPPTATPVAPPLPAAPPPNSDAELNQLTALLRPLGLERILDEAWTYYKGPAGGSAEAVNDWLPTTQAYKERFPGMDYLRQKGQAWSPATYLEYERRASDAANKFGIPTDFIDRADVGKLIQNDVSIGELESRMAQAADAVDKADPYTTAYMRQNYGVDKGDLVAYFLDPDKATPFVERKARLQAAQIGGAATRTGYGNLTSEQAMGLQDLGVTGDTATRGLTELAGLHPLFANLAGETGQITTEEQLAATFGGNATAQAEIERRRQSRQATFEGGGGAAAGGTGRQGLG